MDGFESIKNQLTNYFEPLGFECHPFKVGWYNTIVGSSFQLPYHSDTLCFVILSLPQMFENTFLPFLKNIGNQQFIHDPIDECMKSIFQSFNNNNCKSNDIEIIHDFELTATRRPKILMQTAGHVSGAVRLYQRKDLGNEDPWDKDKYIMGVCLHPKYGGWFAFRGVIMYKDYKYPDLQYHEAECITESNSDVIKLLTLFNYHWRDGTYRDFFKKSQQCYSNIQMQYFNLAPSERIDFLKKNDLL